jgi:2-polyprenyl-6-methoxyphenol hydroxylase-like FAD-dependent oxidoreductase
VVGLGCSAKSTTRKGTTVTKQYQTQRFDTSALAVGMAIEDGFFVGRALRDVDLTDPTAVGAALQRYEDPRKPHTAQQVKLAWVNGKVFHHTPAPLRPIRDLIMDHTPILQKVVGDGIPRDIMKQLALIEEQI